MHPNTENDILASAGELRRLLIAMGQALDALANTAPEPLNHHLIVCAAACELGGDRALQIEETLQ